MLLVIYNRPGFTGERIKNPDSYSLDILRMNGTDSHTLSLNAGDVLQVEFETSKGSLLIKITAPDGTIIYAGNGEERENAAWNERARFTEPMWRF